MADPLICEVTRGSMVESRHRVHVVVVDSAGETVFERGDPELLLYPRSSIKSMQALPLIESGAADALGVGERELALSCASHSGAPDHVAAVSAWLDRLGLGEHCLACGAHLPYDEMAAHDLIRAGVKPTRLNNNCSGKHTGFLAVAKHLGEPLEGYLDPDHPVQKRLYGILTELGDSDLSVTGRGIDGCGIPVYGMALGALARAAAKMAAPKNVSEARGKAIKRLLKATMTHPYFVAGRGRFDTIAMQALGGRVSSKSGAEGVHIAMLLDKGLGIALKTEDGTKRAADTAMAHMLDHLGVLDDGSRTALKDFLRPAILNAAGDPAGDIRMAAF